ncbi:hypothetical protein BLNAU_24326 [Blattamonas nauphoetae]|uniref:Uncharacterized protein n=1 Tax=Blattamonas nauphoetae TaxID=2049346 RepID=A0ABQ9WNN2_9EUKA|nr:hypothetical protein BLNAU_24326 [Blattamonas nauphoetae]
MRRRARLQIGLQPQTNIPLSADTLAMFSNPDEGQQTASISPTLLSFALSLREILESVPLASVGTAYQIAVNDLRRAERELGQNKEMEQANPSQGDQLEQVKSSAQTRFMPNREYLAVSLRGPHKDRLVSEFHRFGIPFKMAPSPIDNTSPLNVFLSPLLSSVHSYFKQETVSSHLLPDISSQIKSLAYQMTSIQNYAFDVLPALAQVKQTITNQRIPPLARTFSKSLVACLDHQWKCIPRRHPPSPTAPVHFDYVSTPSFTSSISDKTTVSMKTHKSDNSDSIPYDVTSSTVGGQVVSIDSETGTVRVTAAPIAGEGTEQTGRGFGHLLMPDRTAISTQTLLDHRHGSRVEAFIEAARVFSNEQGRMGFCEAEDDDPKAMKGKKAKAKKTEPSPIAPQNSKTSRKGRNRATVEETIDNPSVDHNPAIPLLPPDIDFADCDDPGISPRFATASKMSPPVSSSDRPSSGRAAPSRNHNSEKRTIAPDASSQSQRHHSAPSSVLPAPRLLHTQSVRSSSDSICRGHQQRRDNECPHACRQSLNCAAQHRRRVVHHADGTRVFHSFAFGDSPKLVEVRTRNRVPRADEGDIVCGAPQLAAHPHLTRPEEDLVVPQPVQQVRGHRIVDPGNSAEKKKKIVITEPDNKHIHFTPVGNVTVDCEHSTKKPAAKFDNRRVDYCQTFNANHPNSVRYDESLELVHVEQRTATVQCDVFKFVTRLASPLAFAPVVTEVTEAYSSKRPHTARRVFFTALDGTAKELEFMEKKLKEKKLKKERIAEQEIDEARKAKLKQSLRNYKSPLSAGLLLAVDTLITTSTQIGQTSLASLQTSPFILPRLFVIRHNGMVFELLEGRQCLDFSPQTNCQQQTSESVSSIATPLVCLSHRSDTKSTTVTFKRRVTICTARTHSYTANTDTFTVLKLCRELH